MHKHFAIAAFGLSLGLFWPSAPALARCPHGTARTADGSCVWHRHVAISGAQAASPGRITNTCLVQAQISSIGCPSAMPSADYRYPTHRSTYDFRHGIFSAPGGAAGH